MRANLIVPLFLVFIGLFESLMGQTTVKEDFRSFFPKFSTDKDFQLARIKFPLTKILLVPDPKPRGDFIEESRNINKSEWEHEYFYFNSNTRYRAQIYDNFKAELRDTDERVLAWLGIEGGFQIYYYFRRIDGKWYLVKIRDLSIL